MEASYYQSMLDDTRIPKRMQGAIIRWITDGIHPGGFLTAVISNDLKMAVRRADYENRHLLVDYVKFFYNYAPAQCWGTEQKVAEWGLAGGLNGYNEQHKEENGKD